MKLTMLVAALLMATGAAAAPFPSTPQTPATTRTPDMYYLFLVYYSAASTTSPIQLGPFSTEKACGQAATLVESKLTVGAAACLKSQ